MQNSCRNCRMTVTVACSGLQELLWHDGMLRRWPAALCSAYALAILSLAAQWLHSLQLASVSSDTTMQQLCQSTGSTAQLMGLASSVHQTSAQMQQSEEVLRLFSQMQMLFSCKQGRDPLTGSL